MINQLKNTTLYILFILLTCTHISCEKFLDKKPDPKLAIPSSLSDLRSLLDAYSTMNVSYPTALEVLSDNFYLNSADLSALTASVYRNYYLWKKEENTSGEWLAYSSPIKVSNAVLDNIKTIDYLPTQLEEFNAIKGSALFFRGFYFFGLAQIFAKPYHKETATKDLGIPLRLNSNFNEVSVRSSVDETYRQIIQDLKEASLLLPKTEILKTRPTKAAAFGALARTYLTIGEFDSAGRYADLCLKNYDADPLMDYNDLLPNETAPIKRFNKEVIFHCLGSTLTILNVSRAKIDSVLYDSYNDNDLRKSVFFKSNNNGSYQFKGDYNGTGTSSGYVFGGVVVDEIYLIKAECLARKGMTAEAMEALNELMKKRWAKAFFTPLTASDSKEALLKILEERRKELLFRGLRWTDLRRFRNDPDLSVVPKRLYNGDSYTLLPESARYTLQIPINVINLTGMPQND